MRTTVLCALFTGAIFVAPRALEGQNATDSAAVLGFYREWFSSLAQGPERYASFYAVDGMVLPPNAAPSIGRAAIAEWMRQWRASTPYTARPEGITVDEMRFLGAGWVVHRGTLRGQRIPKAGGESVAFETKYMDLLHRAESGRWEVVYRMWSDNR